MAGDAARLKAEGNDHWAAGRTQDALQCYRAALDVAEQADQHVLHSNISAALQKLGKHREAREEADKCVRLAPHWAKGYLRQAAASELSHRPGDAEAALRAGLKRVSDDGKKALQQGLDRLLQVRPQAPSNRHRPPYLSLQKSPSCGCQACATCGGCAGSRWCWLGGLPSPTSSPPHH